MDIIAEHSLEQYPLEACGILMGEMRHTIRVVLKVFKSRNTINSPSRYEIDPEDQLAAFEEAEQKSQEIIGYYHSHPHYQAEPSSIDTAMAFYKGNSYVIYSVSTRSLKSFLWNGEKFIPEEIKII